MSKLVGLLCLIALLACGSAAPSLVVAPPPPVPIAAAEPAPPQAVALEPEPMDDGDPGPIPVNAADPRLGRRDAPVTIVEFGDFQCPFCQRVAATLTQLRQTYGDDKIRLVWKNNPLPFHTDARPVAVAAMALFERLGDDAFWQAHDAFYGDQTHLGTAAADAAARAGTSLDELRASASWARAEAKVDADVALAKRAGAVGTPAFFINGIHLSGAQPYERLAQIVDAQLLKAQALVAHGTPARRVYAELTKEQKGEAAPPKPPEDEHKVYRVPVGRSPVRGKASALVTIVEIADFQCPFCGRVVPTLKAIEAEYRDKVRLVFKHNPLPFHPRAEPAAELAIEARVQRGDKGFWAAHDLLFAKECSGSPKAPDRQACMDAGGLWVDHQMNLDDANLLSYAKALGLDAGKVAAAIAAKTHAATLRDDDDLRRDLGANGTPTFFINGRRLVGAHPIEKFRAVIDEELAKAAALVKAGTPAARVYDKILASAADDLERRAVPAKTK
jgi:protein-disulfide isomerase